MAGESRGKIWRVRLVKTPHGYVGKESLIACLNMLTTDVAISPRGELYVCCHSGPPDWGTGPKGEGRIFKITYTDPKAPQPIDDLCVFGNAYAGESRACFWKGALRVSRSTTLGRGCITRLDRHRCLL